MLYVLRAVEIPSSSFWLVSIVYESRGGRYVLSADVVPAPRHRLGSVRGFSLEAIAGVRNREYGKSNAQVSAFSLQ